MTTRLVLTALVTLTLAAPAAAQTPLAWWLLTRPAPAPVYVPVAPLPSLTPAPTYPVAPLPPVVPPITGTSQRIGSFRYDTIQLPGRTVTCTTQHIGIMTYTNCY